MKRKMYIRVSGTTFKERFRNHKTLSTKGTNGTKGILDTLGTLETKGHIVL